MSQFASQLIERFSKKKYLICAGLSILIGLTFFFACFDLRMANPMFRGWLLEGDRTQPLVSWLFYRNAPWMIPIGSLPGLGLPPGTSSALMDGIPGFVLLFKLMDPILPSDFQPFGIWLIVAYALQAYFGFLIVKEVTGSLSLGLFGAAFFVASPVLFHRIYHITLCGQWMVLVLLWLCLRLHTKGWNKWDHFGVLTLNLIAACSHPYLAMIILGLSAGFACMLFASKSRINVLRGVFIFLPAVILVLASFYVCGYFIPEMSYGSWGFGYYSTNILGLIDSQDRSRFIPGLGAGSGQREGFIYIGLGMICLIFSAAAMSFFSRFCKYSHSEKLVFPIWPLLVFIGLMFLFALSSKIFLGTYLLFDATKLYQPFDFVTSAFRSSGRFAWPLHYFMIAFGFMILGRLKRRVALIIASICLVLQIFDVNTIKALANSPPFHMREEARLMAVFFPLQGAGEHYKKINLIPPFAHSVRCEKTDLGTSELVLISIFTAREKMDLNSAYLSRFNDQKLAEECENVVRNARGGKLSLDEIYLVDNKSVSWFKFANKDIVCRSLFHVEGKFEICALKSVNNQYTDWMAQGG